MHKRTLGLALILSTVTIASPSTFAEATADKYAQAQKPPPPQPPAAATTNNVSVTVNYTGKGTVDPGHAILVFLFSDPNIGAQSTPLGSPQIIEKNGGTATFKDVSASPVYIAVVYNEKGDYTGVGGPPPVGTPVALYSKDPKDPSSPALAVTPGPKTTVKVAFSDARRFAG